MTDAQTDDVEQFSTASRQQLQETADALALALKRHTAALLEMRGGTSELPVLFALNEDVRAAVAAWDDAVFEHTGTFPVAVESDDDEEDEEEEEEEDRSASELAGPVPISVVSRWDLDVIDALALLSAAQAAHRRLHPSESEADAQAWIGENGVAQALYAIVHEHGEPWFDIPGVGAVSGHRAYLRRDGEDSLEVSDLDYGEPPAAPAGEVLFSESW